MSDKLKVLTIGGATQDIYLHYQGADCMRIMESTGQRNYMLFESGAKIEVEKILYYTGGGSTNSAVSFKRLGFDTTCFCMIGDDHVGQNILKDLEKEGVSTKEIILSKEHPSGRSCVINSLKRERIIFAHRGSNGFLKKENIPLKSIKNVDQIYITSLSHDSSKILKDIVTHAKKNKIPVAINPGVSQLSGGANDLKESLEFIDIFILNSSEAKTFTGALIGDEKKIESLYFSIEHFCKKVIKLGPKIVVVTDGANGVYVATEDKFLFEKSLSTEVVDTLGAGDSFGSCFVGCMRLGLSLEDSLRAGIINSSSVISYIGAKPGLLKFEEIKKRLKETD